MSGDARIPFVHELLGIGIWMAGIFAIIVYLDPEGTTIKFALFSVIVGAIGGFAIAVVPFALIGMYFRRVLDIEVGKAEPTMKAFGITLLLTVLLTIVLRGQAITLVDSMQPGTTGDHPLRKGLRAVTIMTAACSAMVAEVVSFSVLEYLGIDTVVTSSEP
jgi:hypothetical protein